MSRLATLTVLAFIGSEGWGVSSSQTPDCSYFGLLTHLNLAPQNEALSTVRPVKNWTSLILVRLDMVLMGILDVDEKSQTVTTHVWIQTTWLNEFLTWNSSNFCGINTLTVPRKMLWIPDIAIQEDVSDTGSVLESPMVTLNPNGMVITSERQRLTSTCQLDLYLFPFDVQRCNITFASMNYFAESLELGTINNEATLTLVSEKLMITQGEWQLTNIEINNYTLTKSVFAESRLVYTVTIVRKPKLYVINFILPLFYFLLLDLASFFIRGEKLSFKVTVLLSISVLLLILKDMLPSTEENLPFIASYCLAVFTLVGLSILEVMLVNFLKELDGYCGEEARRSVDTREVEIQLEADSPKQPAGAEERGRVTLAKRPGDHRDLLKLILEEVRAARQETGRPENGKKAGCYTRLAEIIDSVYFVLYFMTVVIYLTCMYISWHDTTQH